VNDNLPDVWSADPHTIAKHKILQAYLNAWLPILSRQSENVGSNSRSIKYLDCFAGPGVYENGEKGSPLLALEAAINHALEFPVPVDLIFIEAKKERFDELTRRLAPYDAQIRSSRNVGHVNPIHGDCRDVVDRMLAESTAKRQKFGPALCFLDQFGYSSVPMDLIGRILAQPQCEVLSFFFWRELDRFITDATKHAGVTTAFGSIEWQPAIQMTAPKRQQFMQDTYIKCLKERAKAKYVWPFAMADENSRALCWLFFCTNSLRGLEEMKKAMWKVDTTGGFYFSDEHGLNQLSLLVSYAEDRLETDMQKQLAGRTMSVLAIKEWVLTETPAYLFKSPLGDLERRGIAKPIRPPAGRRPSTYPDEQMGMLMEFEYSMF
jgi:three-Cys-motif partner protein